MNNENKSKDVNNGAEPTVGFATVPLWLVFLFGGLFYWSSLYLDAHTGSFSPDVHTPFRSFDDLVAAQPKTKEGDQLAAGKKVYEKICIGCHQPSGLGEAGKAPPLVGSEWVLAAGANRIGRIVLNGLSGPIKVKDQDWNLSMLAWKDTLKDEEIAAALTYVRNSWGNKAAPIATEEIKHLRETASSPVPENADALSKLPEK